jgi:hypothetical protein
VPKRFALVAASLTAVLALLNEPMLGGAEPPAADARAKSGARIRADVEFLADDLLEGREAGTRGFDVAARYVATQLALMGVPPGADDGGYFQKVPFRKSSIVSSTVKVGPTGGTLEPLAVPDEALVAPNSRQKEAALTAPVVFVGHGVTAPEIGHDDYAGVDVKGKIALLCYNAPEKLPGEIRAFYSSQDHKLRNAADHGAVGVLTMFLPDDQKRFSWDRVKGFAGQPAVTTVMPDGTPVMIEPRLTLVGYVSEAGARKLFAGAQTTIEAAEEAVGKGNSKSVALATSASLAVTSQYDETVSENVVGRLEGSDAALKSTSVVLTAHLDHIGVKSQGEGDRINNGAYDNAAGSAILLEVARSFVAAGARPRRSVVIVFLTGEEKGLQGSNFFAHYPVKSAGKIVADVNLDMPVFMTASSDIVAWGSENSSLDETVKRAIKAEGYTLSPDPVPEENVFVRSDQYSFVKQGIPSVYLEPGFTAADPKVNGREVFDKFLPGNYHQPSDDLSLPMDQVAAARFAEANYLVARAIADDPVAPTWKPGNFFGRVFEKQR